MAKRHKYGAKPTVVDGIRFASLAEAKRYGELKLLEKAGEITDLVLQPRFVLTASNARYPEVGGRSVEIGSYVADFAYRDRDGSYIVEDVKGYRTDLYVWKKKHAEAEHGITITEITK